MTCMVPSTFCRKSPETPPPRAGRPLRGSRGAPRYSRTHKCPERARAAVSQQRDNERPLARAPESEEQRFHGWRRVPQLCDRGVPKEIGPAERAQLAERVILNHAYTDGNKRTALVAADMFLKVNGFQLQRKPMEAADESLNKGLSEAHINVAKKKWTSERLAQYYESIASKVDMNEEIQLYTKGAKTLEDIQRQVEHARTST